MKRLYIFLILAAALLILVWFFVWPTYQNVFVLRQEQAAWQLKLQEALDTKQKLTELKKTYLKLQEDEERIMDAIPDREDLPGLLVQLETMASQNGLILNSLDFTYPEPEKIVKAPVVEEEVDISGKKSASSVSVVPSASAAEQVVPSSVKILAANISLTGGYPALKNFLKAVENNLRLSDVTAISYSQQESSSNLGQVFSSGKLTIGLNVYYKK